MPNISFFIPAYNCAATVAESVDSIMETNFTDGDELIIVNDCSTDNTAETLKSLKEKYPAIILIDHKRNKGGGAARNTAVENAKHELLFCLDADNVLEKNSINTLKKELIKKEADIASFQEMRYFSSKDCRQTNYIWRFLPVTRLSDFLADHKNPGSSGNYLFTKESWLKAEGYPEFAGALDTWGFCFRQLASGSKLTSLDDSYYFHRFGANSYYVRDMQQNNMSSVALQIILPFKQFIDPKDLEYMTSEAYKLNWFESFDSRPIHVVCGEPGSKATSININRNQTANNLARKIYNKLKTFFIV